MQLTEDFENLSPWSKFLIALTISFSLIIGNMELVKFLLWTKVSKTISGSKQLLTQNNKRLKTNILLYPKQLQIPDNYRLKTITDSKQ